MALILFVYSKINKTTVIWIYISQTHPPIVRRAVVELGDNLLTVILALGRQELKLFGDECESCPVVVGNVHLEAEGRKRRLGVSKSIRLSIKKNCVD